MGEGMGKGMGKGKGKSMGKGMGKGMGENMGKGKGNHGNAQPKIVTSDKRKDFKGGRDNLDKKPAAKGIAKDLPKKKPSRKS